MSEKELEKEAEDNKPPYAYCSFETNCELWKDGFQKGAEFGYNKANEYAKVIIQDLLDNSDEYARQRAYDFLKENEQC